jgi:hypothetical protein
MVPLHRRHLAARIKKLIVGKKGTKDMKRGKVKQSVSCPFTPLQKPTVAAVRHAKDDHIFF